MTAHSPLDFDALSQDLLRSVRGKATQLKINRQLKTNYNRLYRLESGLQQITWLDFVKVCEACNVDLSNILAKHFGFSESPLHFGGLIKILVTNFARKDICAALKVSDYVLRSWANEKRTPPLTRMLELIDYTMEILPEFFLEFSEKLPSVLEGAQQKKQEYKEFIYQYPWVQAGLAALELESYKKSKLHNGSVFRKASGLSIEDEKLFIRSLLQNGLIENQNGHYVSTMRSIDTRGSLKGSISMRKYWLGRIEKFLDSLKETPKLSINGYFTMALSADAQKKIREAYYEFCNTALRIAKEDKKPKDRIEILSLHLIDLSELNEEQT